MTATVHVHTTQTLLTYHQTNTLFIIFSIHLHVILTFPRPHQKGVAWVLYVHEMTHEKIDMVKHMYMSIKNSSATSINQQGV